MDYLLFPKGNIVVIRQSKCIVSTYFIQYYYLNNNHNTEVLEHYKWILDKIIKAESLTVKNGNVYQYVQQNLHGDDVS